MLLAAIEATNFRNLSGKIEWGSRLNIIYGNNGQGKTKEEALESLSSAIALILEDRREDGLRGLPPDAVRETVTVK